MLCSLLITSYKISMFINENNLSKPISKHQYLSSPTIHREELEHIREAYETSWMSTVGADINEAEEWMTEIIGCKYVVALSVGMVVFHSVMKVAGVKQGGKVFCSDMTFDVTINSVAYEGGILIFTDTGYDTWNMNPVALEKASEIYPNVKIAVVAHLYSTPGKIDGIKAVCDKHGAVIIEDAAESPGATYRGRRTRNFGEVGICSFNGDKVTTGLAGGVLLTSSKREVEKVRR